jgi:hypothetical protein
MQNAIYTAIQNTARMSEQDRLTAFRRRWEIYYGEGEKPLKRASDGYDDSVRQNFAKLFVDKGVAFLFGKEIGFSLKEGKDTAEEQYLRAFWQANHKMSTLQKLATNGGVCGTAFVKLQWNPGMEFPRVIVVDPETVSVTLAEDDIENVTAYEIKYPSLDELGEPIGIRQIIERDGVRWIITDQRGDVRSGNWRTIGEQIWPYEFPPVLYCQNMIAPNEFWGMSDIEDDLIEVVDKSNFVLSSILKILRFHAYPKTFITGISNTEDIEFGPDKTLLLPVGAEYKVLEMQSDLSSSITMHREMKELIHELSRIPEVATGKLESVGTLSGTALEILYQPLIEKTEAKRVTYGELVVELNRRVLALAGHGDNNLTTLHWQELLPKDPVAEAQAALTKKELGVSAATLIQELGHDPDIEKKKSEGESVSIGKALLEAFDRGEAV